MNVILNDLMALVFGFFEPYMPSEFNTCVKYAMIWTY